jgi:SAM-dependent methyltransferase
MTTQISVAWQKLSSVFTERWLGIQTTDRVEALTDEGIHYTPLPYVMITRMFEVLNPGKDDVFLDIGCGKGRVLCCASRLPMKRVIGIEQNGALLEVARKNVDNLRGANAPVDLICTSAETYSYDDATIVYLYNPFNERITHVTIDRLHASIKQKPRRLRIVYANPVHENVFTESGWLQKYAEWPSTAFPGFGYPVSFWEAAV